MAARTSKTAVLTLRISPEEQERLREAARAQGLTVSEYVRLQVPGRPTQAARLDPVTGDAPGLGTSSAGAVTMRSTTTAAWTLVGSAPSQTLTLRAPRPAQTARRSATT